MAAFGRDDAVKAVFSIYSSVLLELVLRLQQTLVTLSSGISAYQRWMDGSCVTFKYVTSFFPLLFADCALIGDLKLCN